MSQHPLIIDAVIPAHEKDIDTLNYCIEGIRRNIPNVRRIIVVSKAKFTDKAEWFDEAQFPFSYQEIHQKVKGSAGWYLQQFIKMYACFVIPDISENVLIVDSDTVFMHKSPMFSEDGIPLYNLSKDQNILENPFYLRVLEHTKKILPDLKLDNIPEEFRTISGISHHMLFQRKVMKDLFERVEKNDKDGDEFYKIFLKYSDSGHSASEYVIYYFFILVFHFNQVKFRRLNYKNTADFNIWKYRLRRKYHYCSFHSYMRVQKLTIKQKIEKLINKLFFYEYWNIGIANAKITEFLDKDNIKIKWFKHKGKKPMDFYADPFGFEFDAKKYIIYEKFNFWSKNGEIAVSELDEQLNLKNTKTIISDKFHSSYPYVFYNQNQLYALIEQNKSKILTIYKFESPYKLVKVRNIIEGRRIVDPSIIKHDGIWWLFFVDYNIGGEKLNILYADDLFGPWQSHPLNPIKICNKTSRSAGTLFYKDKQLYRPTQNCNESYGGSIIINKINQLSKTGFSEEIVKEVFPKKDDEYNVGTHTISEFGDLTLIDGKKKKFIPWKFIFTLIRSTNRFIKKYLVN